MCRCSRMSRHHGDAGMQDIRPTVPTLIFRLIRDQRGNYDSILQLVVFVIFHPSNRMACRLVATVIQHILPSVLTLSFFVRPGASAAIATQSLPPRICTEGHPSAWCLCRLLCCSHKSKGLESPDRCASRYYDMTFTRALLESMPILATVRLYDRIAHHVSA